MPTTLTDEIITLLRQLRVASIGEIVDVVDFDRAAVVETLHEMERDGLVRVRLSSTVPDEIALATEKLLRAR